MIVSRATFGLLGNVVPAVLALVTRLFWGAVLLWFLASSLAVVLVGAELNGSLSERQLLLIGLAGGLAIAVLIAFFGYALLARIQLVLTIVSGVLVIGLIALHLAVRRPRSRRSRRPYGSWELTVTGAVLVFSFVGLVWANSAGDLARYQRPESSGRRDAALVAVRRHGAGVRAHRVRRAARGIQRGNRERVPALAARHPRAHAAVVVSGPAARGDHPEPALRRHAVAVLGRIRAAGDRCARAPRRYSVPIVAVLLAALTLVITFAVPGGNLELFRDGATTLAVPVAAWAGIFAAEMMIRKRRFESQSLLQRGGVYPDVRWLNLIALVVITVIGFGLTTATITWLSWQGYVFGLLGGADRQRPGRHRPRRDRRARARPARADRRWSPGHPSPGGDRGLSALTAPARP